MKTEGFVASSSRFTAIVPAHNSADSLSDCLSSIAEQTYPPYETLVIDDASTDDTSRIARRFSKSPARVRLLSRSVPGPGGYAARNLGIAESRTDWLTFLDADDVWKTNHISTLEDIISKQAEVNVVFLAYEIARQNGLKSISIGEERLFSSDEAMKAFADRQVIHTNGIGVRRDFIAKVGAFSSEAKFKRGADSEFWTRMIYFSEDVYFSTRVTSQYRRENSQTISRRDNYTNIHPVTNFVRSEVDHPTQAIQRLANRKTIEWLKQCPSRKTRLELFRTLYWRQLNLAEKVRAAKALIVKA